MQQREVDAIRTASLARNSSLDLTGVLVTSESHFAQYLEGHQLHLDAVMASMSADARHDDLVLSEVSASPDRRFPTWHLACFAETSFDRRFIQPRTKHAEPLSLADVGALLAMMKTLTMAAG